MTVTDKARMAYIDSEIDKRRAKQNSSKDSTNPDSLFTPPPLSMQSNAKVDINVNRQPAALGKLLEIDLGEEARSRNVERTIRAQRRLDGEVVEEEGATRPKKVRLGRDGKPWRGGRKRRASEDVQRDSMVEQVLRENRRESCFSYSFLTLALYNTHILPTQNSD